jgi:hypothetical protein
MNSCCIFMVSLEMEPRAGLAQYANASQSMKRATAPIRRHPELVSQPAARSNWLGVPIEQAAEWKMCFSYVLLVGQDLDCRCQHTCSSVPVEDAYDDDEY